MEVKPGYKQTEVGVIPEEWTCEELSKFFSFISYGFTNPMPTVHDGVFMITAADINDGRLQLETARKTSETAYLTLLTAKSKPRPKDILLTKDGTLGRLALVGDETICINQSVAVIRPNGRVEPPFLKLLLESPRYQKRMVEDAGGSTIKHIYITIVDKMLLGLPLNRAEQRAIAAALSDVDGLLGGLDRLIAKKRDLKQAAMQQLLTGKVRLPGFHGDWRAKPLGELITHCFSGATPRRNRPDFFQGDIRWITSGELNYNVITDTREKISAEAVRRTNLAIVPAGTFLMAITGLEAEGTRGACGIVGAPSTTNQSCMAVFPTSELITQYLFYYYVLRGQSLALRYCQGTKQQSYTAKLVKQLPIEIPPTPTEQTAIAEVLTEMDVELAALERRREKTRALKQAMMQELLTGRIRLV